MLSGGSTELQSIIFNSFWRLVIFWLHITLFQLYTCFSLFCVTFGPRMKIGLSRLIIFHFDGFQYYLQKHYQSEKLYCKLFLLVCQSVVGRNSHIVHLTPLTREAAIAAVKIVFPQPAFQLLYSAHAQLNMMKEGWPWLLYTCIWWLTFVCCQEMKRPNLHENHQLHKWPHMESRQRECISVKRAACHRTMSLFTV